MVPDVQYLLGSEKIETMRNHVSALKVGGRQKSDGRGKTRSDACQY